MVLGRVFKALTSYSADMTPETAAQRSFRTLRDNSEVKEMLFNKSLYQRGKSVRIYISPNKLHHTEHASVSFNNKSGY